MVIVKLILTVNSLCVIPLDGWYYHSALTHHPPLSPDPTVSLPIRQLQCSHTLRDPVHELAYENLPFWLEHPFAQDPATEPVAVVGVGLSHQLAFAVPMILLEVAFVAAPVWPEELSESVHESVTLLALVHGSVCVFVQLFGAVCRSDTVTSGGDLCTFFCQVGGVARIAGLRLEFFFNLCLQKTVQELIAGGWLHGWRVNDALGRHEMHRIHKWLLDWVSVTLVQVFARNKQHLLREVFEKILRLFRSLADLAHIYKDCIRKRNNGVRRFKQHFEARFVSGLLQQTYVGAMWGASWSSFRDRFKLLNACWLCFADTGAANKKKGPIIYIFELIFFVNGSFRVKV